MENEIFDNIVLFARNIRKHDNIIMKSLFENLSASEVICLDILNKNKDINLSSTAQKMGMTKGALSKVTQKLIKKNYIIKYKKENNKKEIFFKLEDKGLAICKKHEKYRKEIRKREVDLYKTFEKNDKKTILDFLTFLNEHIDEVTKKLE